MTEVGRLPPLRIADPDRPLSEYSRPCPVARLVGRNLGIPGSAVTYKRTFGVSAKTSFERQLTARSGHWLDLSEKHIRLTLN